VSAVSRAYLAISVVRWRGGCGEGVAGVDEAAFCELRKPLAGLADFGDRFGLHDRCSQSEGDMAL